MLDSLITQKFVDVVLTFLIIFVLTLAILRRIRIFSEKNSETVFSILMGLFVVVPHILGVKPDYVPIITKLIPLAGIALVIVVSLMIILGAFGVETGEKFFVNLFAALVVFDLAIPDVLILALFARNTDIDIPKWLEYFTTDEFLFIAVTIAVFGGLVFYISRPDKA